MFRKFFIKRGLRILGKVLRKKRLKTTFIVRLNERVDIPKMDEKQEAKLFAGIYDNICDVLLAFVDSVEV